MVIRTPKEYERAVSQLEIVTKAWMKIMTAQSYTMGDDQVNRASLKEVTKQKNELEEAISNYELYGDGARRAKRAIPLG